MGHKQIMILSLGSNQTEALRNSKRWFKREVNELKYNHQYSEIEYDYTNPDLYRYFRKPHKISKLDEYGYSLMLKIIDKSEHAITCHMHRAFKNSMDKSKSFGDWYWDFKFAMDNFHVSVFDNTDCGEAVVDRKAFNKVLVDVAAIGFGKKEKDVWVKMWDLKC